jgi:DnaB helicase-like protein/AAA domain-containing protein
VAIDRCAELLEPSSFYRESHSTIFAAILAMHRRGDPIEPVLLAAELNRLGVLEKIGGQSRVAELAALVPAAANVGHYAALVLETSNQRQLSRAAFAIQNAAANGGVAMHPELIDEMQAALDRARTLPGEPAAPRGPLFIAAHDFTSRTFAPPEPLLGTDELPILAVGSFNLLAGRPGAGKTTTLLDMACHLAAGVPWPSTDGSDKAPKPWPVPRALRIALIENEGPQESFRGKLDRKLKHFPHSIKDGGGCLIVHTLRWGTFSFADRSIAEQLREELDMHGIDIVMGDPLASLGLEGVGSPAETFAFVQLLRPLGLGEHRAFLFLHHFRERVEKGEDELQRISGAWGGHLDTLLGLSSTHSHDQLRLSYPKVRWAQVPEPKAVVLGKVYNTSGFEAIGEEGDVGLLEPRVHEVLVAAREAGRGINGWMKVDEIRALTGGRRTDVKTSLEGASHMFAFVTGETAKAMGAKSPKTIFWGLQEWGPPVPEATEGWEQELLENPGVDELAEEEEDDSEGGTFAPSSDIPF